MNEPRPDVARTEAAMPHLPYHAGELAMQELFGERVKAENLAYCLQPRLTLRTLALLRRTDLVVLAARLAGELTVFLLSGEAGWLRAARADVIAGTPEHPLCPRLLAALASPAPVGMLGIDFAHGGRVRINGQAELSAEGILVRTREVFPNCRSHVPRLIAVRHENPPGAILFSPTADDLPVATSLTTEQRQFVNASTVAFVATASAPDMIDVSFKGGNPGFLSAAADELSYEDLRGNGMYQSLGNLAVAKSLSIAVVSLENGCGVSCAGLGRVEAPRPELGRRVVLDVQSVRSIETPPRRWLRPGQL